MKNFALFLKTGKDFEQAVRERSVDGVQECLGKNVYVGDCVSSLMYDTKTKNERMGYIVAFAR